MCRCRLCSWQSAGTSSLKSGEASAVGRRHTAVWTDAGGAASERPLTSWLFDSGEWKRWLCSQRRVAICCSRISWPCLTGVP